MEAEKNAGHGYFTACERRHLLWLEVFLGPPGFNSHSRFVLHASSFRSCKNTVTLAKCVCASGAGSLAPVRRWSGEALPMFVRATPTSSRVTLQLVTQLERGCKHFLPNKQPPESALASSLFLPEVEQATAAGSVVVSSSHKAALSPSTTPSNAAPTAAAHTKTQPAWLIISAAGKFWQTRSGKNESCKVTVRDTLHEIFLGFPAAQKSRLSPFMHRVQSQEANARSPQSLRKAWLYQFWENPLQKNPKQTCIET